MIRRAVTLATGLLVMNPSGGAGRAEAAVYINGVNVDGQPLNLRLERCAVTFDGQGNVLISAPGYQVQILPPSSGSKGTLGTATSPPPSALAPQPAALAKKYFVVNEQSMPGQTQYDIDLYLNSRWVRKFHSNDEQVVTEVTQFLKPGPNKVLFVAKKDLAGGRKSLSPEATYRVTLGEGDASGDKVVIDNPLISFRRSADEADDTSQEFAVQGR